MTVQQRALFIVVGLTGLIMVHQMYSRFDGKYVSQTPSDSGEHVEPVIDWSVQNKPAKQESPVTTCILGHSANLWQNFVGTLNKCIDQETNIEPNSTDIWLQLHMGRYNEIKYFLPLKDGNPKQLGDCIWLTIGIGGDSQVEKELKELYPNLLIYGVEPGQPVQYADFKKYGTVIPTGVGVESGQLSMRVRVGTTYEFKKVPIHPFPELLDKYMDKRRVIHLGTLDIEGFEYPLLRAFEYGNSFDEAGIAFCQIDIELHDPGMKNHFPGAITSQRQFDEFLRGFLKNTPYVPIRADTFLSHKKITLANPTIEECVNMFDLNKYISDTATNIL